MISWQRSQQQWKTARDLQDSGKISGPLFDVGIAEEQCSDICGGTRSRWNKAGIRRVFVIFTEGI